MSIINKVIGSEVRNNAQLKERYLQIVREDVAGIDHPAEVTAEFESILKELGISIDTVRKDAAFLSSLYGDVIAAGDLKAANEAQVATRAAYEAAFAEHHKLIAESGQRIQKAQKLNDDAVQRVNAADESRRNVTNRSPQRPDLATDETLAFFRQRAKA